MKNKKILYGLLGIGAIAGFYFWNKNKMPNKPKLKCPNGTKKIETQCITAPCPQEVVCA
jgi:hypothetical protein